MRTAFLLALAIALLGLSLNLGCRPQLVACAGAADGVEGGASDDIAPLADLPGRGPSTDEGIDGDREVTRSGGSDSLEPVTPFGIITPVFSGVGAESLAACDPLDDFYGDCM